MKNATAEGFGLQTKVLHGSDGLNETHAVTAPIWQTSTFGADSAEHMAELGEAVRPDEFYTRYGNPTHRQVAATLAALEGGEAGGGDTRGQQSAALVIVKKNCGVWLHNDTVLRLQVDDNPEPIKELRRIVDKWNERRPRAVSPECRAEP